MILRHLALPLFRFIMGEVLPITLSPPRLLFFSTLLSLLLLVTLLSCLLHISLNTVPPSQPWPPSSPMPCSRNSVALFGCLSSAILSACPVHYHMLLTRLSGKLSFPFPSLPLTPPFPYSTILMTSCHPLQSLSCCAQHGFVGSLFNVLTHFFKRFCVLCSDFI